MSRKGLRSQGSADDLTINDHIRKARAEAAIVFKPKLSSTFAQGSSSPSSSEVFEDYTDSFKARNSLRRSPVRSKSAVESTFVEALSDDTLIDLSGDEPTVVITSAGILNQNLSENINLNNNAEIMAQPAGILDTTTIDQVISQTSVEAAKPKFISPEIFNPSKSSVHDFIRHFERCASANGWNFAHRIKYFGTFLDGPANTWYYRYQGEPGNRDKNWADIKKDFISQFGWDDAEKSIEQKLRCLKQGEKEGIKNYYYRIIELMDQLGRNYETAELQMNLESGLAKPFHNNYYLLAARDMTEKQIREVIFKLDKQIPEETSDALFISNSTSDTKNFSRRATDGKPICYNCGKKGHFQQTCLNKELPKCYNCNKTGHYARNCKMPMRGQQNNRGGFAQNSRGGFSQNNRGGFNNQSKGNFGNNFGGNRGGFRNQGGFRNGTGFNNMKSPIENRNFERRERSDSRDRVNRFNRGSSRSPARAVTFDRTPEN